MKTLFIALIFFLGTSLFSDNDAVKGEYLISGGRKSTVTHLKKALGPYGVRDFESMGKGRYLAKLDSDPGLEIIQKEAKSLDPSIKVQPNFKYHMLKHGTAQ